MLKFKFFLINCLKKIFFYLVLKKKIKINYNTFFITKNQNILSFIKIILYIHILIVIFYNVYLKYLFK